MTTNSTTGDRVNELAAFVADHGRLPESNAKGSAERRNYVWLRDTRLALTGDGRRTLSPEWERLLDDTVPGWADGHREPTLKQDRVWALKASRLEAFVAEHGRFPLTGPGRPGPERRLGGFVNNQQKHERRPERSAWLDERVPGWRESNYDVVWANQLNKLIAFASEHGRFPSQKAATPEERTLAHWVISQRVRPRSEEQLAALNEALPGWRVVPAQRAHEHSGLGREVRWKNRGAQVLEFREVNGRLPLAVNALGLERTLGLWLRNAQYALDGRSSTKLTPERTDWLDTNIPEWRRSPTERYKSEGGFRHFDDDKWQEQATEVAEFIREHGRAPYKSSDSGEAEAVLGSFLEKQHRSVDKRPDRKSWLDVNAPGWELTRSDYVWQQKLELTVRHVAEHGRFPSRPAATKLYSWLNFQRQQNRDSRLMPEREALLDARLPGWRLGNTPTVARA